MGRLRLTKEYVPVLITAFAVSFTVSALNYKTLGIKDSAMLFMATAVLVLEIYLIFKDRKNSILLFIISFPVIVTARKVFYFDFLIFKVTYETIYVSILFVYCFKDIINYLKNVYRSENKSGFNFLIFTAMFLIFALSSSIYSSNIIKSLSYAYISVVIPVMFMFCIAVSLNRETINKIYGALIISCDLSSLYGFFQIVSNHISFSQISSKRHLITFGFHNVNIFAGIVILVLPFILEGLFYGNRDIKKKLFYIASLTINLMALYITSTRGAWLAFIVSVPIIFISRRYRKLLYVMGALFVVGIKPALSYILRRGTSTGVMANESSIARIQSFYTSLDIMKKFPFGTGAGNFAGMYKRFSIEGYMSMPEEMRQNILVAGYNLEAAHNLWLQTGTELGIVSALLFFIIIVNRLIAAVKNFKENRAEIAAISAYLVFSVLTGVEFEHKGIITSTLIIWTIFMLIEFKRRKRYESIEKAL